MAFHRCVVFPPRVSPRGLRCVVQNHAEQEWRRARERYHIYDEGTRAGVRPDLGPFVPLLPAQLAGIADYLQPADRAKVVAASCGLIVSI